MKKQKILATSDWHGDWYTHGVKRQDEIRIAAKETVMRAVHEAVDLYVFAGDLTDPDSGSVVFGAVEIAIEAASTLRMHGIPSVWVSGNHDVIEDGEGRTTLAPLAGLARSSDLIYVFETGASGTVGKSRGALFDLVALPYPSASKPYDFDAALGLFSKVSGILPLVVVSHLSVPGVQPGEESVEMARGRDVVYPIERVVSMVKDQNRERAVLIQGHYHRQQTLNFGGDLHMHIPGSLARLTFGEERHTPGYLILEV